MSAKSGQLRPIAAFFPRGTDVINPEQKLDDLVRVGVVVGDRDHVPAAFVDIVFDRHGRAQSFAVTVADLEGEVTTALIRALSVHLVIEEGREQLIRYLQQSDARIEGEAAQVWVQRLKGRPGRAGRPDLDYVRLSVAYLQLLESGLDRPVERLAEQFGVSRATARNWLHEARRRDILTRPGEGRAGGELTEYGRRLLAEMEDE